VLKDKRKRPKEKNNIERNTKGGKKRKKEKIVFR